jgi:hypothetical protein
MTAAERADLREDIEALRALTAELRQEMRREFAIMREQLDALQRPKVAKVIFDPSRAENGGAPQR